MIALPIVVVVDGVEDVVVVDVVVDTDVVGIVEDVVVDDVVVDTDVVGIVEDVVVDDVVVVVVVADVRAKEAVTSLLSVIVTVQLLPIGLVLSQPDQLVNVEPELGVAVSVTLVPLL